MINFHQFPTPHHQQKLKLTNAIDNNKGHASNKSVVQSYKSNLARKFKSPHPRTKNKHYWAINKHLLIKYIQS